MCDDIHFMCDVRQGAANQRLVFRWRGFMVLHSRCTAKCNGFEDISSNQIAPETPEGRMKAPE